MVDYTNGADESGDDLRATLAAAYAEAEKTVETPAVETPKPETAAETGAATETTADVKPETEPKTGTDGRQRSPDGKFLPKTETDAEAKPESAETPAKTKTEADETPKVEAEKNADGTLKPLQQWSKQHKEIFAQATPQVQQFMLDRERQIDSMLSKKLGEGAEFRKRYEPIEALFKPYEATMREKGLTPVSLMEAWANVEKRLAQGDGIGVIQGLISGYGIDKARLAQALGLQTATPRQDVTIDEQGNPIIPDPAARQPGQMQLPPELVSEIRELRARQDAIDNAARAAASANQNSGMQRVVNQINEFKGETDGKGNLLHPHFEEVENHMTLLAQSAVASKQAIPPLKDLYEQAVWANASTRAKLLNSQRLAEETKRTEEAKTKAKAARASGSSVTGTPGAGQSSQGKAPVERSLSAEIEEAYNTVSGAS
jgi:hypothetical protein